jgi:hypothetical protein
MARPAPDGLAGDRVRNVQIRHVGMSAPPTGGRAAIGTVAVEDGRRTQPDSHRPHAPDP